MRYVICICCIALGCCIGRAASVVWDGVEVWDEERMYLETDLRPHGSLSLELSKLSSVGEEHTYFASGFNLMFAGNWTQSYLGEIICDSSFSNSPADMAYPVPYESSFIIEGDGVAKGTEGESIYLIFKCGWMYETDTVQDPVYGWVEFSVWENGVLMYEHSAWDLDGGPMIVGGGSAVPEPSSGLLMLLGTALVVLRRRRVLGRSV